MNDSIDDFLILSAEEKGCPMLPKFETVSVISDLHLCPNQRLGNFSAQTGDLLVEWTRERLFADPKSSALVLAGDIIDFLLVENRPRVLDLHGARVFVKQVLNQLTDEFDWVR